MNENVLKKYWYGLVNDLKERWPDLTQADMVYISGDTQKLAAVLAKRRHISAAEAQDEVAHFLRRLQIRHRVA